MVLVAALEQWPAAGIPANPGAWRMLTAKHRAIDSIRRSQRLGSKLSLLLVEEGGSSAGVPRMFLAASHGGARGGTGRPGGTPLASVYAGSGGGRESNPPTTQRAVHQF